MKKDVLRFDGLYEFLSNFHMCEIVFEGMVYPSTEHAYQAAKDLRPMVRERIAALPTAFAAKKAGNGKIDLRNPEAESDPIFVQLRSDWDQAKDDVMYWICRDKFTRHQDLRQALLRTGDGQLVEGNHWGDTYWGVCRGVGENRLGKILMRIRDEIRNGIC